MKCGSYQQFAIVAADSAQTLTDQLNAKMIELKDKSPTVTFEGMIARISYTETYNIPESAADEYELEGVQLTCEDCPYFTPILKADGSEDKRIKWGDCPFCEYGRTSRKSRPCKLLYQRINSGEVRLCLADTE